MSKLNANSLKRFDAITMIRHYGTVAFGVVMFIVFSVLSKSFCTWDNLMIMLRSMSMLCICALGFTFVMAAGGFDMSIGDASGLVNMIFVYSLISYGNLPLAIVLGLLIALKCCSPRANPSTSPRTQVCLPLPLPSAKAGSTSSA